VDELFLDDAEPRRPRHTPLVEKPAWRRNATGALGALVGILLLGLLSRATMHAEPWLLAPVGASALLVFALPASPLAQPWPVIGGNLIAAVVGMACQRAGFDPPLAAALAVGLATALMMATRCLHPPAGGTAALMALGSPAIAKAGLNFLAAPVALNFCLLVVVGVAWNRLTGHAYPHHPKTVATGHTLADIEAVLADWDDNIDVSAEDLAALITAIEARAHA